MNKTKKIQTSGERFPSLAVDRRRSRAIQVAHFKGGKKQEGKPQRIRGLLCYPVVTKVSNRRPWQGSCDRSSYFSTRLRPDRHQELSRDKGSAETNGSARFCPSRTSQTIVSRCHSISETVPSLSANFSVRTPSPWSIVTNRFDSGSSMCVAFFCHGSALPSHAPPCALVPA